MFESKHANKSSQEKFLQGIILLYALLTESLINQNSLFGTLGCKE
jgi:hypothetical protein